MPLIKRIALPDLRFGHAHTYFLYCACANIENCEYDFLFFSWGCIYGPNPIATQWRFLWTLTFNFFRPPVTSKCVGCQSPPSFPYMKNVDKQLLINIMFLFLSSSSIVFKSLCFNRLRVLSVHLRQRRN